MSFYIIYILQLNQHKVFIYASTFGIIEDVSKIKTECEILYDFPKKYQVESIITSIKLSDYTNIDFEINSYVKKYMALYGIDNIRGGSYSDELLTDEQNRSLIRELSYINNTQKSEIILELFNEIKEMTFGTQETVKDSWSKYLTLKEYYHSLTHINNITIDCDQLTEDLEWMKNHLIKILFDTDTPTINTVETHQRYSTILPYIKCLSTIADIIRVNRDEEPFDLRKIFAPRIQKYMDNSRNWVYLEVDTIYSELDKRLLEYEYEDHMPIKTMLFLKYPEFSFDTYFCVNRYNRKIPIAEINAKYIVHILAIIMYYFNYIKIHLAEVKYEIDNYDFVTQMKYKQFPIPYWDEIYTQFIEKYEKYEKYAHVSGIPNAIVGMNLTNDVVL